MPETIVAASPRKDPESGGWGLWVEDFDGAEAGCRVPVQVVAASGKTWHDEAVLKRQVLGPDGIKRWVSVSARTNAVDPTQSRDVTAVGEVAQLERNSPSSCGHCRAVAEGDPPPRSRPLAEIVGEATALAGWVLDRIDSEWVGDHWHVRIGQHVLAPDERTNGAGNTQEPEDEPF